MSGGAGEQILRFVRRLGLGRGTGWGTGPLAVVYSDSTRVGQACASDTAAMLRPMLPEYDVILAGPGTRREVDEDLIGQSLLWVQPGGGELEPAYKELRKLRKPLRKHVRSGGRYLGICLGGYLAGATPGFNLLPGDTDQYIGSRGSEVDHDRDTVLTVNWRDRPRPILFQDGPVFKVDERDVDVIARYRNGEIAALTTSFGEGRVAVCGPHPEATPNWFTSTRPRHEYVDCRDLAQDLVTSLLR